ncbi:MAG: hypothetical protein IJU73_00330, partial [Ruminococcus sp.]|nr:hypothetical protein [Ruminococcus sp.]
MRKRYIITIICALFLTAAAVLLLPAVYTSKDDIGTGSVPEKYCISDIGNRIEYQTDGNCSAYAAAYVLRQTGKQADGEELSS